MEQCVTPSHLLALALAWIAYFAFHSLLADAGVKDTLRTRWPALAPMYRLLYNAIAIIALIPPVWLTLQWRGDPLWRWQGSWSVVANGLALIAVATFVRSFKFYDASELTGLRQWRARAQDTGGEDTFVISPLHRFVRHPWYFLALIILWTRDMDATRLLGATLITLYFVFGSRLEEKKLLATYGSRYAKYRDAVPALLPRPWRYLRRRDVADLSASASEPSSMRRGK